MSNSQKAKKHHFVPECYLKKFMRNEVLYTLDIDNLKKGYCSTPKKNLPSKICYIKNYYEIQEDFFRQFNSESVDSLFIESNVLKALEDKYNSIHETITSDSTITTLQAVDLSDFIIQMKSRNPFEEGKMRSKMNEWIDSSMDEIGERFFQDPRFAKIQPEIQKALIDRIRNNNKNDPDYTKKMLLFTLIGRHNEEERNEKFRSSLADCRWRMAVAPSTGPFFITSDNPGFSLTPHDSLTYNTRFIDGFTFYYPLSPRHCLLIGDYEKDNCYSEKRVLKNVIHTTVSGNFVIQTNNRSIQCINRLLIGSDDWYLKQIAEINEPTSQISQD